MRIALALTLTFLFLIVSPRAEAGDKIWSAVLLARNVNKPKAVPVELQGVAPRLKRVFGYNEFELVGTDTADLADGSEQDLKPSKIFWVSFRARSASIKEARGGYLLNLKLNQGKTALVDTVTLLAPDSPIFFRGPLHGSGQVLIVLQVVSEQK